MWHANNCGMIEERIFHKYNFPYVIQNSFRENTLKHIFYMDIKVLVDCCMYSSLYQ